MDESEKKQIPLRISAPLYAELSRIAADEFRSLNGQIEFMLSQAVKKRRRTETEMDAGDGKAD
ncbi:MAG: Arc family DNA binding domain-containing protein [Clostridiales bacterium]|jgi:hypothetical protein|nr:Arc family DNA binding domain-containing protein [Clostridiales bacterium]